MKRIILVLIVLIVFLNSCQLPKGTEKTQKGLPTESSLSDIQATACNEADQAGTCDSRLTELGIVPKEDCCKVLGKCC